MLKHVSEGRLRFLPNIMLYSTFGPQYEYEVKFSHQYTPEEEGIILETLNNADASRLNRFAITTARSKRLLLHRKKYGNFKNLHQVLAVEAFSVKVLKSLCQSILNPSLNNLEIPTRRIKHYNFVVPELTPKRTQKIQQVVGVHLGTLSVSWSGIEVATNNVLCWGHHVLGLSSDVKRHDEAQILQAAYEVQAFIPKADIYAMESCVSRSLTQQCSKTSFNQQKLQLSTMLLVLLNQRAKDECEQHCVVFQRNSLWCRLYGTLIGSERVSAQSVVQEMLAGAPGPFSRLHMPNDIGNSFYQGSPIVREEMCSALLLTTSFVDVNIKALPECLSLLCGKPKKG